MIEVPYLKFSGLLLSAVLLLVVVNAGCVGFVRDSYRDLSSTPAPSLASPVTATPIPLNETIERQYAFVDGLNSGLAYYDNGILAWNASRDAANAKDWDNATREIGMAKAYMEQARTDFIGIKAYADTPDEANLSERWNDTAYYESQAVDLLNLSYQENAYQASRSDEPNYVKYNYYVSQANQYIELAKASKNEAVVLERKMSIWQQDQIR